MDVIIGDEAFIKVKQLDKQLSLFSLGNFEVKVNDRVVTDQFRTDKERGLLTYLVWESHRPHRREVLGELLWPEREEGIARTNLRQALLGVRRAVGDSTTPESFFNITNEFIQFNPSKQVWLDAAIFASHIKFAHSHAHRTLDDCPVCVQHLEDAVTIYQGDFLDTVFIDSQPFQEWVVFKRETLFRDLLSALQTLTSYYDRLADYETARKFAVKQVSLYPLEERAHRQLMRLLVLSGQRAAALEQYQICRKLLMEELEVEPGPQTQALYEQIRRGILVADQPIATSVADLEKRGDFSPHNLPTPLTSFVGREEELGQLALCLNNPVCRLITLIGPPGVGKTRLAVQAARANLDIFPDGVWFIPIDTLQPAEALFPAIANVIGFASDGQPIQQALFHYLETKKALIMIDSFEHLTTASNTLLEILGHAPAIKILVTSRERLNYQVACIFEIGGLSYPMYAETERAADFPAVRLFLNRALHRPGQINLPTKDLKEVIRICQLLKGLPLAVELAAASAHKFSYAQIAEAIQSSLDLLKTSMLDVQERHQSMYVAIQQSWKLLSDEEQMVFARLGIFQGSFTLEAAVKITGTTVLTLASLMDKSLMEMDESRRYKLQIILRNFAVEKLRANPGEIREIEERFSRYYMAFLHQKNPDLDSKSRSQNLCEIEQEMENIRSAWAWITKNQDFEGISQGLASLWSYFNFRDHLKDGEDVFQAGVFSLKSLSQLPDSGRLLSRALAGLAWFFSRQGEYDAANKFYLESIACFDMHHHSEELVFPYFGNGFIAYQLGDYSNAAANFGKCILAGEQSGEQNWTLMAKIYRAMIQFTSGENVHPEKELLDILLAFEKAGNTQGRLRTLKQLGDIAHIRGDLPQAKHFYDRTSNLAKEMEHNGIEGLLSLKMGNVASEEGEFLAAKLYLQDALGIFEHTGDQKNIVLTLRELGSIAAMENQFQDASRYFRQALDMAVRTSQQPIILDVLSGIACMFAKTQRQETAWELLGLIQTHAATHPLTRRRVKTLLTTCNQPVDEQKWESAFIRGRSLDLMHVVAEFRVSL